MQNALRLRLWHLLFIFAVLTTWTSTVIPLGEGPDELPHFTVTRYIVQHGRLPDTAAEHESFQPPLYYLLSAAVTFWIDMRDFVAKANADYDAFAPDTPKTQLLHTRAEAFPYRGWALAWHIMRALSLLMSVVTSGAIYGAALALTGQRNFALLSAAFVAFLPGFIFMSSVVNNDNLAAMFAALLCWRIVKVIDSRAQGIGEFLFLGVLLGLGLLSKTSMLAFLPTIFITLLVAARLRHWSLREWLRANLSVFGVAALVSGWYYLRNYALYQDWLAWPLVLAANAVRTTPLTPMDWLSSSVRVYRSFWLEWIGITLEPIALLMVSIFSALAMVGIVYRVLRIAYHAVRNTQGALLSAFCLSRYATLFILALHLFIIFVSWTRWTQTVLGTEQARLFYPALTTIILFLALGLRELDRAIQVAATPTQSRPVAISYQSAQADFAIWLQRLPVASGALAILLFALALITPLHYIAPTYTPAPRIAALPPSAQPISATFKDKMRLVGWELPTTRTRGGDTLKVGLYWEALKDLSEDDWLKLQLLDAHDNFLLFKDGSPSAGRDSTDSWRRGEKIASWHRLQVPADAPRGVYRLALGVHPYGRKNWFPIAEENMWTALGDQLVLAEVTVE